MINPRRLRALIVKESLQIVRDPSSILIAVVLPIILLFIFGYGISLDTDTIRVGLVLEDSSADARSLAAAFRSTAYLDVRMGTNRREFEDDLSAGRLRGLVVIPEDFSAALEDPDKEAQIQAIGDGTEPNTATFVENYSAGVLNVWLGIRAEKRGRALPSPVRTEPRFWYNAELESRNFLVPGSIAIVMTLIGTLLTALVIAREWERGTMEAMMGTPITVGELLLGKLIPYFLLGLGSMVLCFLVAVYFYGVPFRGSFAALLLVSSVFLFAALGQGLLISTLGRNQFVASQAAVVSGYLPAFMLSGFIFEITSMPLWIQVLTYGFAARYLVTSLQTLFLAGNVWWLILPNCAAMLLIGAVFFAITARKTSRRVA